MIAEVEQLGWIETAQALIKYCLPPIDRSPYVLMGSLFSLGLGLFIAFRAGKFIKMLVTGFGLLLGVAIGIKISGFVHTPSPITAAVCGIGAALLAHKTYRWWLVAGSVLALVTLGLGSQLDPVKLIENMDQLHTESASTPTLPTAQQQMKNLHSDWATNLGRLKTRVVEQLETLGPRGWLVPLLGAILGCVIAWYALQLFAVAWIGWVGAVLAITGATTLLCAVYPPAREPLLAHPQAPGATMVAIWVAGMIYQAKEARFPKKAKPQGEKKD